ncbi:MAG: EF-hand domain-containing protein [Proteobacteria bacterium]|nr:EF-hand domain-containing protein [Pseudomonadota bacterium]
MSQWREKLFQKLDSNGDGSVDKSEFEAGMQAKGMDATKADSIFAKLDTDTDGSVSKTEFAKGAHHHKKAAGSADDLFAKIDTDGDGSVSKSEFEAFGQKLSSQMTNTLISGQEVGSDNSDMRPPPFFGAQAYGQSGNGVDPMLAGLFGTTDGSSSQSNFQGQLIEQLLGISA